LVEDVTVDVMRMAETGHHREERVLQKKFCLNSLLVWNLHDELRGGGVR
jgi:hypothetical protein